uniref:Uncharacterized protein n=1 Tax=viral metagenome TaxID=1070528 RepID=A0A6M3KR21_9ZZZZ
MVKKVLLLALCLCFIVTLAEAAFVVRAKTGYFYDRNEKTMDEIVGLNVGKEKGLAIGAAWDKVELGLLSLDYVFGNKIISPYISISAGMDRIDISDLFRDKDDRGGNNEGKYGGELGVTIRF